MSMGFLLPVNLAMIGRIFCDDIAVNASFLDSLTLFGLMNTTLTDVPSYFCDSYCSWQKGGVENVNGLIREYFPKKTNIDTIPESEVYRVQEKLNNRPRKSLNYVTPNEIFAGEVKI